MEVTFDTVTMCIVTSKATIKITKQRVIANELTKETKQNHRKYPCYAQQGTNEENVTKKLWDKQKPKSKIRDLNLTI